MHRLRRPARLAARVALGAFSALTAGAALAALPAAPANTADAPEPPPLLAQAPAGQSIEITGRHYDNAVGSSDAASQGVIRAELLQSRPALRPGEVLEFVPGVIVTQHSGDGKANQYFLRGFNLDHGTDFATTVNGMPVNMPTHGHGQGYSDLNFLLPEIVDRIEYRKGPYFARNGDFASAGSADIVYRTRLDAPLAAVTLGGNGFRRGVAAGSAAVGGGLQLLGAFEAQHNDGPWAVAERLRKTNGVLTLSSGSAEAGASVGLMAYAARWRSTDQVPQRLIDAGSWQGRPFGRFDTLDPGDGGSTHRHGVSAEWHRLGDGSSTRLQAWAIDYALRLYSDFTYALERPDQGDQFSQQDRRRVFGASAVHAFGHDLLGLPARSEFGAQLRHDRIRVCLFDTVARSVVATTRGDRVRQTQAGAWAQTSVELAPWLRAIAGLRADTARFGVDSLALAANSGRASATLWQPKLSLVAGPWARTEFFVNAGRGMHSNDARGTTARVDPKCLQSGSPPSECAVDAVPGLVASRGFEVGARSEWLPGLQTSLALWKLDFDSELVYVGDAGATEPNRPSRRRGVEWNNRWVPLPWLLFDADLAWTHARFSASDPAGDRIPNSVDKVASVAATVRDRGGWSASVQWRYLGSGALVEDGSVRSHPSLTTNVRVTRRIGSTAEVTLDVFNVADRKVNDIEYFYESRLPGEAAPVADRHVHPAEPRTVRLTLKAGF